MSGFADFLRGVETGDPDQQGALRLVARNASILADGLYRVLTNGPPEELRGILGAGVTVNSIYGQPSPLIIVEEGFTSASAGYRSDATDVLGEHALGVLDDRLRSLSRAPQDDDWPGLLHNTEARVLPPLNLTWGSAHRSKGALRGTFGATVVLPGGGNTEAVLTAGHVVGPPTAGQVDDLDDGETGQVVDVHDPCSPSAKLDAVCADVAVIDFSMGTGPHHPPSLQIDDFRDGRAAEDVTFHLNSGTSTSQLDAFFSALKYSSTARAYGGALWLTTDCKTQAGDSGAAVTVSSGTGTEELIGHVIGDYRDVHSTHSTYYSVIQSILWQLGALGCQLARIP